jgi:hypothetical protein
MPPEVVTNHDVIRAMDKPGKISTRKPTDESGFEEVSILDQ